MVVREMVVASGASLDPGFTDTELARIEDRFSFKFGADHREFLATVQPIGSPWLDWRHDSNALIRGRLAAPVDGVLFDVAHNSFWPKSWGTRPDDEEEALGIARTVMLEVPRLIPLWSNRYLPADFKETGYPVFSVHQTDTVYYGRDLMDYLAREFKAPTSHQAVSGVTQYVRFWAELAENRTDDL